MSYLEKANSIFKKHNLKGVRVCFEQATWNSSDGNIKTYFHVHVQHDDLPEFNSGIGDSDFDTLMIKVTMHIVPELKTALEFSDKIDKYIRS